MSIYKFYYVGEKAKGHLVGILPERRRQPSRITHQSIMNRWRTVVGNIPMAKGHRIYYEATIR